MGAKSDTPAFDMATVLGYGDKPETSGNATPDLYGEKTPGYPSHDRRIRGHFSDEPGDPGNYSLKARFAVHGLPTVNMETFRVSMSYDANPHDPFLDPNSPLYSAELGPFQAEGIANSLPGNIHDEANTVDNALKGNKWRTQEIAAGRTYEEVAREWLKENIFLLRESGDTVDKFLAHLTQSGLIPDFITQASKGSAELEQKHWIRLQTEIKRQHFHVTEVTLKLHTALSQVPPDYTHIVAALAKMKEDGYKPGESMKEVFNALDRHLSGEVKGAHEIIEQLVLAGSLIKDWNPFGKFKGIYDHLREIAKSTDTQFRVIHEQLNTVSKAESPLIAACYRNHFPEHGSLEQRLREQLILYVDRGVRDATAGVGAEGADYTFIKEGLSLIGDGFKSVGSAVYSARGGADDDVINRRTKISYQEYQRFLRMAEGFDAKITARELHTAFDRLRVIHAQATGGRVLGGALGIFGADQLSQLSDSHYFPGENYYRDKANGRMWLSFGTRWLVGGMFGSVFGGEAALTRGEQNEYANIQRLLGNLDAKQLELVRQHYEALAQRRASTKPSTFLYSTPIVGDVVNYLQSNPEEGIELSGTSHEIAARQLRDLYRQLSDEEREKVDLALSDTDPTDSSTLLKKAFLNHLKRGPDDTIPVLNTQTAQAFLTAIASLPEMVAADAHITTKVKGGLNDLEIAQIYETHAHDKSTANFANLLLYAEQLRRKQKIRTDFNEENIRNLVGFPDRDETSTISRDEAGEIADFVLGMLGRKDNSFDTELPTSYKESGTLTDLRKKQIQEENTLLVQDLVNRTHSRLTISDPGGGEPANARAYIISRINSALRKRYDDSPEGKDIVAQNATRLADAKAAADKVHAEWKKRQDEALAAGKTFEDPEPKTGDKLTPADIATLQPQPPRFIDFVQERTLLDATQAHQLASREITPQQLAFEFSEACFSQSLYVAGEKVSEDEAVRQNAVILGTAAHLFGDTSLKDSDNPLDRLVLAQDVMNEVIQENERLSDTSRKRRNLDSDFYTFIRSGGTFNRENPHENFTYLKENYEDAEGRVHFHNDPNNHKLFFALTTEELLHQATGEEFMNPELVAPRNLAEKKRLEELANALNNLRNQDRDITWVRYPSTLQDGRGFSAQYVSIEAALDGETPPTETEMLHLLTTGETDPVKQRRFIDGLREYGSEGLEPGEESALEKYLAAEKGILKGYTFAKDLDELLQDTAKSGSFIDDWVDANVTDVQMLQLAHQRFYEGVEDPVAPHGLDLTLPKRSGEIRQPLRERLIAIGATRTLARIEATDENVVRDTLTSVLTRKAPWQRTVPPQEAAEKSVDVVLATLQRCADVDERLDHLQHITGVADPDDAKIIFMKQLARVADSNQAVMGPDEPRYRNTDKILQIAHLITPDPMGLGVSDREILSDFRTAGVPKLLVEQMELASVPVQSDFVISTATLSDPQRSDLMDFHNLFMTDTPYLVIPGSTATTKAPNSARITEFVSTLSSIDEGPLRTLKASYNAFYQPIYGKTFEQEVRDVIGLFETDLEARKRGVIPSTPVEIEQLQLFVDNLKASII